MRIFIADFGPFDGRRSIIMPFVLKGVLFAGAIAVGLCSVCIVCIAVVIVGKPSPELSSIDLFIDLR